MIRILLRILLLIAIMATSSHRGVTDSSDEQETPGVDIVGLTPRARWNDAAWRRLRSACGPPGNRIGARYPKAWQPAKGPVSLVCLRPKQPPADSGVFHLTWNFKVMAEDGAPSETVTRREAGRFGSQWLR